MDFMERESRMKDAPWSLARAFLCEYVFIVDIPVGKTEDLLVLLSDI